MRPVRPAMRSSGEAEVLRDAGLSVFVGKILPTEENQTSSGGIMPVREANLLGSSRVRASKPQPSWSRTTPTKKPELRLRARSGWRKVCGRGGNNKGVRGSHRWPRDSLPDSTQAVVTALEPGFLGLSED